MTPKEKLESDVNHKLEKCRRKLRKVELDLTRFTDHTITLQTVAGEITIQVQTIGSQPATVVADITTEPTEEGKLTGSQHTSVHVTYPGLI